MKNYFKIERRNLSRVLIDHDITYYNLVPRLLILSLPARSLSSSGEREDQEPGNEVVLITVFSLLLHDPEFFKYFSNDVKTMENLTVRILGYMSSQKQIQEM